MTQSPPPYTKENAAITMLDKAMLELAELFGTLHHNRYISGRIGNCLDELSRIREELTK